MADEPTDTEKLNSLLKMQITSLARTLVLQDALVVLANVLTKSTPDPDAAMRHYIGAMADHHRSRAEMQPHAYDALSFEIGANFDALVTALRGGLTEAGASKARN